MFCKKKRDPRLYQLSVLSLLLLYATAGPLQFDIKPEFIIIILFTVLITHYASVRAVKLSKFDCRSPLISGLSLCLLLRTNHLWCAVLAAVVTILSKFVLRLGNKHIFNPTNFGLVTLITLTNQVWISPGQWGSFAFFSFLIACSGGLVVNRAERSDVTWAFLGFYVVLIAVRAIWLGDPIAIPLHQLQNGAFLIFAFFMISDPKTTPNSRIGRITFAFLVAIGALYIQFTLYRTNGLLWSLVVCSLLVPLIDYLLPGTRYEWTCPSHKATPLLTETNKAR